MSEGQRELSGDSILKFLVAHLKERWGSWVTRDADFIATPTGTTGLSFVVSLARGM